MLRFEGKQRVLKDSWNEDNGWLPLSVRSPDLKKLIGQDLKAHILVDEDLAHNPKPLRNFKITREGKMFKVNEHEVFLGRPSCDCEFYLHTNGKTPCPHIIAAMKLIIEEKKL